MDTRLNRVQGLGRIIATFVPLKHLDGTGAALAVVSVVVSTQLIPSVLVFM